MMMMIQKNTTRRRRSTKRHERRVEGNIIRVARLYDDEAYMSKR